MGKLVIYQVLPRLFTNTKQSNKVFGSIEENGCGKFNDFSESVLDHLRSMGFTHVWYTGVLEHATRTDYSRFNIAKDNANVVKGVAGSPYAIKDYYDVDPDLAENVENRIGEFEALIKRSHDAGLKVLIDFVPNHLARHYSSDANPPGKEAFGMNDQKNKAFDRDNNFYYLLNTEFKAPLNGIDGHDNWKESPALATGNDCFMPNPGINDWFETIKLNYGINYLDGSKHFDPIPDTWIKMFDILNYWAIKGVDGFRCDMAEMVPVEFWNWCITKIKKEFSDVIFIAEVYQPNLYKRYIQDGGFDYLYDKVGFYDCLINVLKAKAPLTHIAEAWKAIEEISDNMLFFMENHDEIRLASDHLFLDGAYAWPAFFVSALYSSNPIMVYCGQEIGERGMDAEGYSGSDGRTSIFDYWSLDSFCRYNSFIQGNESALLENEFDLYAQYKTLLSRIDRFPALHEGSLYDLMWCNSDALLNDVFAWLRYAQGQIVLLLANFSEHEKNIRLLIPDHAFKLMTMQEKSYFRGRDILNDENTIQFPKEIATTSGIGIRVKAKECVAFLCS